MTSVVFQIVGRLVQAALVALAILAVSFALFRFVGDPVLAMAGPDTGEAELQAIRVRLGLDLPGPVQFARFVARAATGDFGLSYTHRRPVIDLLVERLPATLELVLLAGAAGLLLAVPAGAFAAVRSSGPAASVVMAISTFGVAVPTFLTAIGLILVFSVWLGVLPSFGRGETRALAGLRLGLLTGDGWAHAAMPAAVMTFFQVGVITRLVRGEMLEVLRADFIRFCRARGLPPRSVYVRHALRNTLVPVVATLGVQVSTLLAFSVVTERVFQWPGLGQLFLQSIETADVPVLSAYLVFVGLVFMAVNLGVDALQSWLDPRTGR